MPRKPRREYQETMERIIQLHRQGFGPRVIGSKVGLETTFVEVVLRNAGEVDPTLFEDREADQGEGEDS